MMQWRFWLVLFVLVSSMLVVSGCATRSSERPIEQPAGIERPARPIGEEQDWTDRAGEIAVVILVIGIAVGGILIPILLF